MKLKLTKGYRNHDLDIEIRNVDEKAIKLRLPNDELSGLIDLLTMAKNAKDFSMEYTFSGWIVLPEPEEGPVVRGKKRKTA